MKGLLIKDFNLLKNRGVFLLVVVAAYAVFQLSTLNSETAVGFSTLMIAVFSLTTIVYDEYENGMPFLFTLPIRRIDYVREKYVFSFLITTGAWLIMGTVCFLFDAFISAGGNRNFLDQLVFCVAYLIAVYFMISLQIALKLKFAERSSVVLIGVAAAIGVFVSLVYVEFGESLSQYDLNWTVIAVIAVVVLFALMFGFYRWSVRIMEKREF